MMLVGHVLDHVVDHMIIGLMTTALQMPWSQDLLSRNSSIAVHATTY